MLYRVASNPVPPPDAAALEAMVARARAGDLEVLPELRSFLDGHPEFWRHAGDLARRAMDLWIGLIAGSDLVAGEALARRAAAMASELAGSAATPLERLLIERGVACWLQANHADASVAQSAGLSLRQAAFALKRQDSAHRRYLQAIGALAMVRRLLPAAAEPIGFRPPVELTWDLAGDGPVQDASSPTPEGPQQPEAEPVRPALRVLFDPADGPGPCGEAARSTDAKAISAP